MKKITKKLMITLVNLLIITSVWAQSPQSLKYQAIARDANGDVLDEQNVSLRISILKTSVVGLEVYKETFTATTNNFGLINLNIGTGTPVTGDFITIDWANDSYFIKVEMDPTGGTTYQAMGTSQLLSVPYALHAKTAESVIETDSSDWKLSGNTGTISGTDFIGTTDNQDFDIRTNNAIKWRFKTNGTLEFLNTGNSIFIGIGAGANDDLSDNRNIFIGNSSGNLNTTGSYNTANGFDALYSNTTGNYNTANGYWTLYENTTGSYNIVNGYEALYYNTTGSSNVAIGSSSLFKNTDRSNLVAIGDSALFNNGTGATNSWEAIGNTAIGSKALYSNTIGNNNTAIGFQALYYNTTGSFNTANGYKALYYNTTGTTNTANGFYALYYNTTGTNNSANAYRALFSNTTGNNNTANGYLALYYNTTGSSNVAIGTRSLYKNTDRSNLVAIGDSALFNNGTGATTSFDATENTAIGHKALYSNTTGYSNTANGSDALFSNTTGIYNTANGYYALYYNTTGYDNTANGFAALYSNTTGNYNTALGYFAFSNGADYTNSTALGYSTAIIASNQIRLGNSSVLSIGGQVGWTTISDKRFKKDVMENVPGLNFIMKLKPVTYHLDMNAIARFLNTPDSLRLKDAEAIKANMLQTGFLAQDVEKSAKEIGFDFSGVDAPKNENDHYGLRYAEFVVPLVKATQEQQKIIEEQQKEIEMLKQLIFDIQKKMEKN